MLTLLKEHAQDKGLRKYNGFFKFVNKINRYHRQTISLQGKDKLDLGYKYHYKVRTFDPSIRHIRHFPKPAQRLLKAIQSAAEPLLGLISQEKWLQLVQYNPRTGWIRSVVGEDMRIVCDKLLGLALDHPQLLDLRKKQLITKSHLPLPLAVSFFVGRKQELKTLSRTFEDHKALIIDPPLTGPGGIGKTQLALRVLQELEEEQYD